MFFLLSLGSLCCFLYYHISMPWNRATWRYLFRGGIIKIRELQTIKHDCPIAKPRKKSPIFCCCSKAIQNEKELRSHRPWYKHNASSWSITIKITFVLFSRHIVCLCYAQVLHWNWISGYCLLCTIISKKSTELMKNLAFFSTHITSPFLAPCTLHLSLHKQEIKTFFAVIHGVNLLFSRYRSRNPKTDRLRNNNNNLTTATQKKTPQQLPFHKTNPYCCDRSRLKETMVIVVHSYE